VKSCYSLIDCYAKHALVTTIDKDQKNKSTMTVWTLTVRKGVFLFMKTITRMTGLLVLLVLLAASVGQASIETLAPGVTYEKMSVSGPNVAYVVRIDRSRPEYKLRVGLPHKTRNFTTKEKTSVMSSRYEAPGFHVLAATNSSFYDTASTKNILGTLTDYTGCIQLATGWSQSLSFPDSRDPVIAKAVTASTSSLKLASGANVTVNVFNQDRPTSGVACYTPEWGPTTGTTTSGTEVVIRDVSYPMRAGKQVSGIVSAVSTTSNTAIPAGGLVISAVGSMATVLNNMVHVGDRLKITTKINNPLFNNS
jgi:hypothetical protein